MTQNTLSIVLTAVAIVLAIAVGWMAVERGVFSSAPSKPPHFRKIVTAGAAPNAEAISPGEITVIDGDTIRRAAEPFALSASTHPSPAPCEMRSRARHR